MPSFQVGDRVRGNVTRRTGTIVRLTASDQNIFVRWDNLDRDVWENPNVLSRINEPFVVGDRVELIPGDLRNSSAWTHAGTVRSVDASGTRGDVAWDGLHTSPYMDFSRLQRTNRRAPVQSTVAPRRFESQPVVGTRVQRQTSGGIWYQGRVTETCGSYAVHVAWDRPGPLAGCNDWVNLYAVDRVRRPQVRREGPRRPKVKKSCTHAYGVLTTASGKIKCGSCGVDVSSTASVSAR